MPDLGSAKIKRKIYQFETKKRYQHVNHYRIKERPPIDMIKDRLKALFNPKKEEKKAAAPKAALASGRPPPGGFNFVIFGATLTIALIVLALGWLFISVNVLPGAGAFEPQVEKPSIDNVIDGAAILSAGEKNEPLHVAAAMVDYQTKNLDNYTIQVTTYDMKIPSEVFMLNSERYEEETKTYPDFVKTLRIDLAKRKIALNEITVKQLETLPEGAIVVVPSGYIPEELIGVGSTLTMEKLVSRGVVVVYIGQPFTSMLNGTVTVPTPQPTLKSLPVSFDESADLSPTGDIRLFQPLYGLSNTGGAGWSSSVVYGAVSIAKKEDGAFVFVPQTLDGGWRKNFTAAADDISKIISDTPWAEPNAPPKNYTFINKDELSGKRYVFSEPFPNPEATIRLDFTGYSSNLNNPVMETMFWRQGPASQSDLFIEFGGQVVPTNITSKPVRMNARLREPVSYQPDISLVVDDAYGQEVQDFPQGNINVQAADPNFDPLIYVDRGEYIVRLIDDSNRIYTQTYMNVVSVDITYEGQDRQKPSVYLFDLSMGGEPYSLGDVSVSVDNGKYGTYTFSNANSVSVDVGGYTGSDQLPIGNHSFEFTAGGLKKAVSVVRATATPPILSDPVFWAVIALTALIVGFGVLFARQEETFYAIDIPDFPPVARTKIPLSPDAVLGIFEKLNDTYRWQNTPLTPSEVKNGFKDIFYHGKPVIITDYNVEYLLEELEKKGYVKESVGYYGLATWLERSKHSMDYIALMRRLRDICVNNAIPFTGTGESETADSEITVVGQQMFVHFYDRSGDVRKLLSRTLSTISKGITILLFKNPADKDAFQDLLNSSPSAAPLIAKMEADSGSLQFLTVDEFEKMLIEFKSV